VTAGNLIRCGAHAFGDETLQFGLHGAVLGGHDVRPRLRTAGDTVELLCEQVGGLFIATSAAVRPIVHAMTGFRQDCIRTS
jgi:hypothetical protein